MRTTVDEQNRIQANSANISMIVGIVLVIVGLVIFILTLGSGEQGSIKLLSFEITGGQSIIVIVVGSILIVVPWLPSIIHPPQKGVSQETPEEKFDFKPRNGTIDGENQIVLHEANTRFLLPSNKNEWEIVNLEEFQEIDDVSIWDLPLFASGRSTLLPSTSLSKSAGNKNLALSHYLLKHQSGVEIILGEDSLVDSIPFSGKLPEELFDRFLEAGIMMQLTPLMLSLQQDPSQLRGLWEELEIAEPIPVFNDNSPDIEGAIAHIRQKLIEETSNELDSGDEDQIMSQFMRLDLPLSRKLFHSASIRIYRQEDILNVDPMLKLLYGNELSTWNFLNCLNYIDSNINFANVENMKWDESGATVSFTITTQLDNVKISGQNTSLTIRRIFFITKDVNLFHLVRINLLSGPNTFERSAYEGLQKLLGSYRIGPYQITG